MIDLTFRAENIIECINEQTKDMDNNERAMVLLFVSKMVEVVLEIDIVDTYRKVGVER